MSNPSKRKGTAWETEIVRYLNIFFPNVERRTARGKDDRGDIAGVRACCGRGVVIEAKNCQKLELSKWVTEAEREAAIAGDLPVVWAKRRGQTSAADGFVIMPGYVFAGMLRCIGETHPADGVRWYAAMHGRDAPC